MPLAHRDGHRFPPDRHARIIRVMGDRSTIGQRSMFRERPQQRWQRSARGRSGPKHTAPSVGLRERQCDSSNEGDSIATRLMSAIVTSPKFNCGHHQRRFPPRSIDTEQCTNESQHFGTHLANSVVALLLHDVTKVYVSPVSTAIIKPLYHRSLGSQFACLTDPSGHLKGGVTVPRSVSDASTKRLEYC